MLIGAGRENAKWLSEYSNLHLHELQEDLVKFVSQAASKAGSIYKDSVSIEVGSEFGDFPILEKTISVTAMLGKLTTNYAVLEQVNSFDFDIFEVAQGVGRENTLTMVMFKIMNELPHHGSIRINNDKLITFLTALYKGYRRDVQYHNDLHGADVA